MLTLLCWGNWLGQSDCVADFISLQLLAKMANSPVVCLCVSLCEHILFSHTTHHYDHHQQKKITWNHNTIRNALFTSGSHQPIMMMMIDFGWSLKLNSNRKNDELMAVGQEKWWKSKTAKKMLSVLNYNSSLSSVFEIFPRNHSILLVVSATMTMWRGEWCNQKF